MSDDPDRLARILEFAVEAFRDDVEALLDDPRGVLEPGDIHKHLSEMRRVSTDLGLDFDALVDELGTAFEVRRLRTIIDLAGPR